MARFALERLSKPLVKGLLDQSALSVLYGESNVGKTFMAMDIAFAISRGRPWGGMRTTQMPVLYIEAEGGQGARKRCAALSFSTRQLVLPLGSLPLCPKTGHGFDGLRQLPRSSIICSGAIRRGPMVEFSCRELWRARPTCHSV